MAESTGISFVIPSSGERSSFVDEMVLPAIKEEAPVSFEAIVVGRYEGRRHDCWLRAVEAPVGGDLFHMPLQAGVEAGRHPWMVLLGDDMLLESGWGNAVEPLLRT